MSKAAEEEIVLLKDGSRVDGRKPDELRPIEMKVGVLKRADGSAYVAYGETKVIAAVYGPRELHPRHLQDPEKAIVRCRYDMVPFSVKQRKRPGPDRRSIEISKVTKEALEPAIFLENFPKAAIDIFIEVIQADASTRVAGITAASLALADAGIPMRDLVAAVTVGKIDNTLILDVCGPEDQYGVADMPVAMMPRLEKITLLQMDGKLTLDEFKQALELAKKGIMEIYEKQKEALKKRCEVNDTSE